MPAFGFGLIAAVTFLSAFLLFQIELIIAKLFLPAYGGSYLVWGACVVFFQFVLLVGYVFAHLGITRLGIKKYLWVHLALFFVPFLFFPGRDIQVHAHTGTLPLMLDIFVGLLTSIGPVFFMCSTVSLVTQAWIAGSANQKGRHPYSLYAISNIGSFAALWTYPFVFEYLLPISKQIEIWRWMYVVLVVLNIAALKWVPIAASAEQSALNRETAAAPVAKSILLRWFLLSAGAVMLFLSVTNIITYEVAPMPLLWIIPLSVYLLSFILCFKEKPWYPSWMAMGVYVSFVVCIIAFFRIKFALLPATLAIVVFNAALFFLTMHAQNELIKSKPAPRHMTLFYVMISLGGFCGGFVTSWVIPLISNSAVEFLCGLALIAVTFPRRVAKIVLSAIIAGAFVFNAVYQTKLHLLRMRNYYGIYLVYNNNNVRIFSHGTTLHGLQFLDPQKRFIPLGYYSPNTPFGDLFKNNVFEPRRLGAVGLGAGSIAMFSSPERPIDFYELDPDVVKIAEKYFWYLSLAPGPVKNIVGDARVSIANSGGTMYDMIIVDAFGADSVPVHLINKDGFELYRRHLTERGGIVLHIPSRYFNLKPVIANVAKELNAYALYKSCLQDGLTMETTWAVMTWDKGRYETLVTQGWVPMHADQFKPMRVWTDDYSTTLPIIMFNEFWYYLDIMKHNIQDMFNPKSSQKK